jgi:hypothetical protein
VVVRAEQPDRYLVIDGYQRIAALEQLGRDTVEAVVRSLTEVEALLLDRSMRSSVHETAAAIKTAGQILQPVPEALLQFHQQQPSSRACSILAGQKLANSAPR